MIYSVVVNYNSAVEVRLELIAARASPLAPRAQRKELLEENGI
jgi:hypothetical protein